MLSKKSTRLSVADDRGKGPSETHVKVRFRCKCGKVFIQSSKYSGKNGRCPACGEITRIPFPKKLVTATLVQVVARNNPDKSNPYEVAISEVTDSKGKIVFECTCGHGYSVDRSHGGRKARCRKCKRFLRIPLIDDDENGNGEEIRIRAPKPRRNQNDEPVPVPRTEEKIDIENIDHSLPEKKRDDPLETDIDSALEAAIRDTSLKTPDK